MPGDSPAIWACRGASRRAIQPQILRCSFESPVTGLSWSKLSICNRAAGKSEIITDRNLDHFPPQPRFTWKKRKILCPCSDHISCAIPHLDVILCSFDSSVSASAWLKSLTQNAVRNFDQFQAKCQKFPKSRFFASLFGP